MSEFYAGSPRELELRNLGGQDLPYDDGDDGDDGDGNLDFRLKIGQPGEEGQPTTEHISTPAKFLKSINLQSASSTFAVVFSVISFIALLAGSIAIIGYLMFKVFTGGHLGNGCPKDPDGSNAEITNPFSQDRTFAILPNMRPTKQLGTAVPGTGESVSDLLKDMIEKHEGKGFSYRTNQDPSKCKQGIVSDHTFITGYKFEPVPDPCFDTYYWL